MKLNPTKPFSTPRRRQVLAVALLAVLVLLRFEVIRRFGLDLLDAEEFRNHRLRVHLTEGSVGHLTNYILGAPVYGAGEGSIVVSLLLVPIGWLVPDMYWASRVAAILWTLLGAIALARIARHLVGERGPLLALTAVCLLPPRFVMDSLTAKGNYAEAATLGLLLWWAALSVPTASRSRARVAIATAVGFLAVFSVWFTPGSLPLTTFTLLCLPFVWRGQGASTWGAAAAGMTPAVALWILLLPGGRTGATAPGHFVDAVGQAGRSIFSPHLPLLFKAAWLEWPVHASSHPISPVLMGAALLAGWGAVIGALVLGARRTARRAASRERGWVFVVVGGATGLGLPLLLVLMGWGPAWVGDLGISTSHFFDPRPAFFTWWVWALAFVVVVDYGIARAPRATLALGGLGVVVFSPIQAAWILSVPAGPGLWASEDWLLCPSRDPSYFDFCVDHPPPGLVTDLPEVAREASALPPMHRRALLKGVGAVQGTDGCGIQSSHDNHDIRGTRETELWWSGAGWALARCAPPDSVDSNCATAPTDPLRALCRAGAASTDKSPPGSP